MLFNNSYYGRLDSNCLVWSQALKDRVINCVLYIEGAVRYLQIRRCKTKNPEELLTSQISKALGFPTCDCLVVSAKFSTKGAYLTHSKTYSFFVVWEFKGKVKYIRDEFSYSYIFEEHVLAIDSRIIDLGNINSTKTDLRKIWNTITAILTFRYFFNVKPRWDEIFIQSDEVFIYPGAFSVAKQDKNNPPLVYETHFLSDTAVYEKFLIKKYKLTQENFAEVLTEQVKMKLPPEISEFFYRKIYDSVNYFYSTR